MVSAPRFTIVMPTHYRPDSIAYAIRSVLVQTEPSFELLVVGDGAAAGTAEAVARFSDARIRWFDFPKAPHFGYANRNRAMAEARGELVAFAADDDLMLPDHLELLGNAFESPSVQWAYSQAVWVSADGIAAPDLTNLDLADEREAFEQRNSISGGALVFRRSALAERGFWPEQWQSGGDWQQMRWLLGRYGAAGLQRILPPTFLHFSAARKSSRHSAFPLLEAWIALADTAAWWPSELHLEPDGKLPQERYWQAMQEPSYVARLRRAIEDVTRRVALEVLSPRTKVNARLAWAGGLGPTLLRSLRETAPWRSASNLRHKLRRMNQVS